MGLMDNFWGRLIANGAFPGVAICDVMAVKLNDIVYEDINNFEVRARSIRGGRFAEGCWRLFQVLEEFQGFLDVPHVLIYNWRWFTTEGIVSHRESFFLCHLALEGVWC